MGAPDSWLAVVMLPGLLVFFGLLWWFASIVNERNNNRQTIWKWLAVLPLLFALFVGFRYMYYMWNPETGAFYRRSMMFGDRVFRRVWVAHYIAWILPLASLLAVLVTAKIEKRRAIRAREDEY